MWWWASWSEAERGVELMRADSDGRATFLVHPEAGAATRRLRDLSQAAGVSGRLRDTLRLTNGLAAAPQGLLPRLAHCFLVADRASAQNLAPQHPDCYFLLPDGVSYHGHAVSGGRKTGGGPLALKRELRELSGQVELRQRETDALIAEIDDLERGTAELGRGSGALAPHSAGAGERRSGAGSRAAQAGRGVRAGGIAAFGGAAGVWSGWRAKDQRARAQREDNQRLVGEKEQARFDQEKALEVARGEF